MRKTLILVAAVGVIVLMTSCSSASSDKPAGEGTPTNPVALTVGTAHQGTLGDVDDGYYKFTTAGAGNYTVAVTQTNSDFGWEVDQNSDFSVFVVICDDYATAHDEVKTANGLSASTTYYLDVYTVDKGGNFTVTVTGPF